MIKDAIISVLLALSAVEHISWFATCTQGQKIGVFVGIAIPLIIFCFFCEEMVEKWRKWRRNVKRTESEVKKLRYERREIATHYKAVGRESGHAFTAPDRP